MPNCDLMLVIQKDDVLSWSYFWWLLRGCFLMLIGLNDSWRAFVYLIHIIHLSRMLLRQNKDKEVLMTENCIKKCSWLLLYVIDCLMRPSPTTSRGSCWLKWKS